MSPPEDELLDDELLELEELELDELDELELDELELDELELLEEELLCDEFPESPPHALNNAAERIIGKTDDHIFMKLFLIIIKKHKWR